MSPATRRILCLADRLEYTVAERVRTAVATGLTFERTVELLARLKRVVGQNREGELIASWGSPGGLQLSEHTNLEIAAAVHRGHQPSESPPLRPEEPVPGCGCPTCLTLAEGGDSEDASIAEHLVQKLATRVPEARQEAAQRAVAAWAEVGSRLPSPGVLVQLATRVPGARRRESYPHRRNRWNEPLPVEAARRVNILEIARRLQLGTPVERGSEWAVNCPFHHDEHPSLYLNRELGVWYCFPCGDGGDGIELYQRARNLPFAEAVKELAGEVW